MITSSTIATNIQAAPINESFWRGKTVLITGHTGFKGSWLTLWLQSMGARPIGYALAVSSEPSFFERAHIGELCHASYLADVRDSAALSDVIKQHRPEIVFHLAAQPLVRASYRNPLETYATNVMGTANLLEAVRTNDSVKAVVVVTTDKVYENREWIWSYRENDDLGGYDPYSSSKACAELVTSAFATSFFPADRYAQHGVGIASVRAGNVIGGGDWAEDRLVPDIIRSILAQKPLVIRYPNAIRPWQHVLEPLSGYIAVAEQLYTKGSVFNGAWNFAPASGDVFTVGELVRYIAELWGESVDIQLDIGEQPHETTYLQLDASKARRLLGWKPRLTTHHAFAMTTAWYKYFAAFPHDAAKLRQMSLEQIHDYLGKKQA